MKAATAQPLHQLLEEAENLPIKKRVPHLEQLLDAGSIDEPVFVFLAYWSIREKLDDYTGKDYPKLYLKFGSERLYRLQRSRSYRKLFGEGRLRFRAEREDKVEVASAVSAAERKVSKTLGHGSKEKVFATKEDLQSLALVANVRDLLKERGGVSAILAGEITQVLNPYRVKSEAS